MSNADETHQNGQQSNPMDTSSNDAATTAALTAAAAALQKLAPAPTTFTPKPYSHLQDRVFYLPALPLFTYLKLQVAAHREINGSNNFFNSTTLHDEMNSISFYGINCRGVQVEDVKKAMETCLASHAAITKDLCTNLYVQVHPQELNVNLAGGLITIHRTPLPITRGLLDGSIKLEIKNNGPIPPFMFLDNEADPVDPQTSMLTLTSEIFKNRSPTECTAIILSLGQAFHLHGCHNHAKALKFHTRSVLRPVSRQGTVLAFDPIRYQLKYPPSFMPKSLWMLKVLTSLPVHQAHPSPQAPSNSMGTLIDTVVAKGSKARTVPWRDTGRRTERV
ncbi:hypothetical protein Ndes2437B_g01178 [Nannochloris sp. 'desiccata']